MTRTERINHIRKDVEAYIGAEDEHIDQLVSWVIELAKSAGKVERERDELAEAIREYYDSSASGWCAWCGFYKPDHQRGCIVLEAQIVHKEVS